MDPRTRLTTITQEIWDEIEESVDQAAPLTDDRT
jgi:hypothetical protein